MGPFIPPVGLLGGGCIRTSVRFYMAVFKLVLLFRAESWAVKPRILRALGGLIHWLEQKISGHIHWYQNR